MGPCIPPVTHSLGPHLVSPKSFVVVVVFLGPHLEHMEVPRLGVQSELQLLAYTTAAATPDPSCICDLHRSLGPCRIFNPLSEARDGTPLLTHTMWGS